jgi:pimeloyl-ACP methyl ester carboxylesterase
MVSSTDATMEALEHPHLLIHEESVHSADGTRIGYRRLGQGPAVVFVHGSVSTHTDWMPAAKLLSVHFTCLVMDRRGRRGSGVGHAPYSIEREYEDIEAVLAAAGSGAMLAGHSYGAICALGTALRTPVPKLVLYEPTLPVGGLVAGAPLADYARAIEAGDPDLAMEIGLREFIRLTPEVIVAMRTSRAWPKLRGLAASWTRELEAMDALPASVEPYRGLQTPTLLLVGSNSREHPMKNASRALASVLPDVRVEILEGQDHMGLRGAPETVARLVAGFLAG